MADWPVAKLGLFPGRSQTPAARVVAAGWRPGTRPRSRTPLPKLPPNLPGQSWKLSPAKRLSGQTMRPIWAITTLSTILKSSTGKAGKTGKSRNSRRKNQAKQREILSDMLDGIITLEEGEARWTAPSMGGSLETFKAIANQHRESIFHGDAVTGEEEPWPYEIQPGMEPKTSQSPRAVQGPDGEQLPIEVLKGSVGFHLGTHREGQAPSRVSVEYWPSEAAARTALETGDWTANRNLDQPALEFTGGRNGPEASQAKPRGR